MDKKQFFKSFVSLLPDNSGNKIEAFEKIQNILASIQSNLSNTQLKNEFEQIERELLFHVWMLEQVCNGDVLHTKNKDDIPWPLIVISVSWEIIFTNRAYCTLSGLSPEDVRSYENAGILYEKLYEWTEIGQAQQAVSRLHAGKGYRHLELSMKHSGQRISWNSYGWVGESLEIRSGRAVSEESNQRKEQEKFYRGSIMNTARLVENLYQVSIHSFLSEENEQYLMWTQEFLSMFDFLWNHSELFMEIINVPTDKERKVSGFYNTIYAQFLKYSFSEQKRFRDILSIVHGNTIRGFFETRKFKNTISAGKYIFHGYNKCPVAEIHWQYLSYPYKTTPGYDKMFSAGVLTRKITKRNFLSRIFGNIFRRHTVKN